MLNRLSIRYKISLIALIGLIGIIIFQLSSYLLSIQIRTQLQQMITEDFVLLQFANETSVKFSDIDKLYLGAYSESELEILDEANEKADLLILNFNQVQESYLQRDVLFIQLNNALKTYINNAKSHTAYVITENPGWEAQRLGWENLSILRERYLKLEREFIKQQYQKFELKLKDIESQESFFVTLGLVIGVILSLMLAISSVLIIRHLVLGINYAVTVAESIADGNFDDDIKHEATDETGRLIRSLLVMRNELKNLVGELKEKSNFLKTQRSEIMQKNMELEQSSAALLEKTVDLEQSSRYKSQFLSTMSHELRTPLNSIIILAETLAQNRQHHLDDKEVQHAKVIHSAGEDLLSLINDILDLSKVEEGKMDVVIDHLSFKEFASELIHQFELIAVKKNVEFIVNVADDVPAVFYSDKYRLMQIVRNFISNALKFTEKGGVYVDVTLPTESFKVQHPDLVCDNVILLSVKDTGIGVDPTKKSLIFEAFRQADGSTSRKYGGTGLGLSISVALSHLLGGYILVDSDGLGCGSLFTLVLPILSEAEITAKSHLIQSETQSNALEYKAREFGHNNAMLIYVNGELDAECIMQRFAKSNIDTIFVSSLSELQSMLASETYSLALLDESLLNSVDVEDKQHLLSKIEGVFYVSQDQHHTNDSAIADLSEHSIEQLLQMVIKFKRLHASCVLVIEDNPVFQEVLKSLFVSHYFSVEVAADCLSAMSLLRVRQFDCLILDFNLPDCTGIDILKQVRQMDSYRDTPAIVFTAEELSAEMEAEIGQYANKVMTKTPKVLMSLYKDVKHLIAGRHKVIGKQKNLSYVPGLLKGRRILLVDDDARNIYSISAILEAEQVHVDAAMSGKKALQFLEKQPILDLILLDIMMPEMDGYEVLDIIRQDPLWVDIPIIAVTAKAQQQDKELCLQKGANDYLSKPLERKLLLDSITHHLS